jgi:signal transduction histidine kinase
VTRHRPTVVPTVVLLALLAGLALTGPGLRAQEAGAEPVPPLGDQPVDDPARFPAWFRDLMDRVQRNATSGRARAEAKLAEARAAGDRTTEAWALLAVATAHRRQNDYPAAIAASGEALALAEKEGGDLLLFNAHYIHGRNRQVAGDTVAALDHFLRSLGFADAQQSANARLTALGAVAVAQKHLGDLPRARVAQEEALALAERLGHAEAVAMYANNLAGLLETLGDRAGARRNYERALAYRRTAGNRMETDDVRESLAMLDLAEGRPETALAALEEILANRRQLRGKLRLTGTLLNLSEVLQKLGRLDEAFAAAEEARGHAEKIDARRLRARVEARLAALHEARGDFAAALAAARREFAEREAIAGEAARSRATELQLQYDASRREQELARLQRLNEAKAAENRVAVAELRAREAELRLRDADLAVAAAALERTRANRLTLGVGAGALVAVLALLALHLRSRLRAARRIHAETDAARVAAEEADRLKTRFLGIASHDIRSPLGNIAMMAESLRDGDPTPAERADHAAMIGVEARRVLQMAEDFLALAALESGRFQLRLSSVPAAELLTAAAGVFTGIARARRQRIDVAVEDPGLVVEADADRIHQVLTNLLSNALKFSPDGSTVEASMRGGPDGVVFAIRDHGPGLSPEAVARLFQPFQRLGETPAAGASSHGLGLSIAHEIVQRHGGRLRVESTPGQGATFLVELPRRPPPR